MSYILVAEMCYQIMVKVFLFIKTTPKWACPVSRDPISKFWDPNNVWTKTAIRFKFGIGIEDGPSLRTDHKTTPKLAWPGSRDLISKFRDTLNNLWTNWAINFKVSTEVKDRLVLRREYKTTPMWAWPGSRDPMSRFWNHITFERKSHPLQIWYRDGERTTPA